MELKLDAFKENKMFMQYENSFPAYYLVPKKDIVMKGNVIVHVNYKNMTKMPAKLVAKFAYNVIQDSKIIKLYEKPIDDETMTRIITTYNNLKDD
jgi:hypothetical protein